MVFGFEVPRRECHEDLRNFKSTTLGRVAPIVREFRDPQAAVPDVAKTHKGRENEQECEGDKRQPQCLRRRRLAHGLGWCHVNMLCHGPH